MGFRDGIGHRISPDLDVTYGHTWMHGSLYWGTVTVWDDGVIIVWRISIQAGPDRLMNARWGDRRCRDQLFFSGTGQQFWEFW